MMTAETGIVAVELSRAEELQEPLLVEPKDEPSQEVSQRRGKSTTEDPSFEPLEVAEQPEESVGIGVAHLRYGWILFQCVWPAILMAFDIEIDGFGVFGNVIILLIFPPVALFLLMVFWKGNNIHKFRFRDALPTAVWLTLIFINDNDVLLLVLGLTVALPVVTIACYNCYKHGVVETTTSACESFYYNAIVRPSNRITLYKKLEEDFFEQQHQQEAAEQEQLEAQYEALSHLEELAPSHPRKPSIWMVLTFAALGIWVLVFLFYVAFVLLSENMMSPTTVDAKHS